MLGHRVGWMEFLTAPRLLRRSARNNAWDAWKNLEGAGKRCHRPVGTPNQSDLILNLWILSEAQLFLGSLN